MSLAEKLDKICAAGVKRVPEDKRFVMEAANTELFESNIMDGVVKVGDRLPEFLSCPAGLTKPSTHPNRSQPNPSS
jgi:hypothetical protein